MPSSSIRPVSRRFPDSSELWEETNLPMCVVVTPLANDSTNKTSSSPSRPLSSIPKCLHCGAPHPTKATHFRPVHQSILLCYLCGQTSSTTFLDQQDARLDETLDPKVYDTTTTTTTTTTTDEEEEDQVFDMDTTWRLPAMTCPPVWWIVLDASPTSITQHRNNYWTAVGSALETAIAQIPPYVHVGIVSANSTLVSSWDLTSPIPHVHHYPYTATNIDLCLVPADVLHKSCIQSALRAVADNASLATESSTSNTTTTNTGMALGLTIELILEYMEQAKHPGDNPQEQEEEEDDDDNVGAGALKYAGGKILCLLGNPPLEIDAKPAESQPPYFQGGVAGACSGDDKWEGTDLPEGKSDPSDMTPENLKEYAEALEPEDLWDVIGTRCANAALGVDILVVVPETETEDEDLARLTFRTWYGLPLLRVLSDTSGAPGPLLFGSDNLAGLQAQILARAPWQHGMAFGAELRLRSPPGFDVEATPVEPVGKNKMQIATFMTSGGVAGPAVATEPGLWIMGTCDSRTTLTIDMEVEDQVQDRFTVDGFGEVALKPVLQTCVAYTCIETDDEDGTAYTVRKMKIANRLMPLATDAEPIYDALDPEALAVALFHKLALNAVQDGIATAQMTGEAWLQSLLVCVYNSAIVESVRLEEVMHTQGVEAGMETSFVASARSLDQEGDLEAEDVLMGKGHAKVALMPMIVYALLQCDALRPTVGSFRPSMDARCAAMTQMASMTPSELAKCIAPSLQLWSTAHDEPIMETLDLNKKTIEEAITEMNEENGVLFLESPQQILLSIGGPTRGGTVQLGPVLKAAVEAAENAPRTKPFIHYALESRVSEPTKEKNASFFHKFLLEDKGTASGAVRDFAEWKVKMAASVQEELEKTGSL